MKKYLLLIILFCFSFEMKAQYLTNRQIYNFSVGDVKETYSNSTIINSPHHWEADYDSIISKTISINSDTIFYSSLHIHVGFINQVPPGNSNYFNTKTIQSYSVWNLDSLPIDTLHNFYPDIDTIIIDTNSCNHSNWTIIAADSFNYNHEKHFISGLGGPYYSNSEEVWHGYESCNLTFFKTNCDSSGIRFDFSKYYYNGVQSQLEKRFNISIFPNPITSTFTISKNTNENMQFHLYNLIGQQVLNTKLRETEIKIERNNLAAGTYLFSIVNASGKIIENGKLIFE